MNNALISIIIPVYNVEKYIRKCLDSVKNQSYTKWECILVDDGSPDNAGKICDEYADLDSRFKVIHKKNEGVTEARITGLQNSLGDYVTFIDSDDYVSINYIEHLYDCIVKYNVLISHCQKQIVCSNKKKYLSRYVPGIYNEERVKKMLGNDFFINCSMALHGKLFKKNLLDGMAMTIARGLWMGEDLVTFLYIMYNLPSLYISSEGLYFYVQHDMQATQRWDMDMWNNQVTQWERILEIDKMNYLRNQLPYRMFILLKKFLILNATHTNFNTFKHNVILALQPDVVHHTIIAYSFKSLNVFERVLLTLVRHRCYVSIYYIIRLLDVPRKLLRD